MWAFVGTLCGFFFNYPLPSPNAIPINWGFFFFFLGLVKRSHSWGGGGSRGRRVLKRCLNLPLMANPGIRKRCLNNLPPRSGAATTPLVGSQGGSSKPMFIQCLLPSHHPLDAFMTQLWMNFEAS